MCPIAGTSISGHAVHNSFTRMVLVWKISLLVKRLDHPKIGKQINTHTRGPRPSAGAHYVQSLAAFITQLLIDSTVE